MQNDQTDFRWYDTVEGEEIEQGDLLLGLEVFFSASEAQVGAPAIEVEMQSFNLMVMTQTCDIQHGKVKSLLLCPRWDLWDFIDAAELEGQNWGKKQREALQRGNLPGYHLLNEANQDGLGIGLGVVDFHEVYTAPTTRIREFAKECGKRLRLRPPYKEHLSQAFARFFMRVGLPIDIPMEKLNRPA